MRDLERCYSYVIEPYLPNNPHYIFLWRPSVRQLINEKLNHSKPVEIEKVTANEPDYMIEKFLFYENFMKKLHVLNIIHTACFMCDDLIKVFFFTNT